MNQTIDVILKRKSIRAYEDRPIAASERHAILQAAMRAPTAGNMMLYSIIYVKNQTSKETLAHTCDNQPFIAEAPLVLLFLADYQRWYDYFLLSGVEDLAERQHERLQKPEAGDLFLACCDALIAAQTAVIAAESLGIGSCYIGDILENYETHRALFKLPDYVFPICLLCFGYPTQQERERAQTSRYAQDFIVFEDEYRRLEAREYEEMYRQTQVKFADAAERPQGIDNVGQMMYDRKFSAGFTKELRRSVKVMLRAWEGE
jgi:nitroreductase